MYLRFKRGYIRTYARLTYYKLCRLPDSKPSPENPPKNYSFHAGTSPVYHYAMKKPINKCLILATALAFAVSAHAATVVNFNSTNQVPLPNMGNRADSFALNIATPLLAAETNGYTGQSIYGAFSENAGSASVCNINKSTGGARIRWNTNSGGSGDNSSALFLFKKDEFLNGLNSATVSMNAANDTVQAQWSYTNGGVGATARLSARSLRLVIQDSSGWHISEATTSDTSNSFSLEATSLSYFDYDPTTSLTTIGASESASFNDIQFFGFYVDATRGPDALGVNAGLQQFSVKAENTNLPPVEVALKGSRPNIIFFLGDDQNITDQSVYGNTAVPTPITQTLSEEALVFHKAFTGQAICAPSRSMLYTGRYPIKNGCFINHSKIRPRIQSLPDYLVPLGYNVILAGKSHVSPSSQFPWTHRWNSLSATEGRPHGWIPIDQIEAFLADPGPAPFCMMVTSHYPHPRYITDRPYTVNGVVIEPESPDYKPYYASIAEKEAELAAVLSAVETNGLANNTIVFFADDHGSNGKFTCYDKGLNVAFMVRWPGIISPGQTNALTSFADFLPTAIELAGGTAPATLCGNSMIPLLEGEEVIIHDYVYGVTVNQGIIERRVDPQRSIHNGRYHLIWNFNSMERITREGISDYFYVHGAERSRTSPVEVELFDTQTDPKENTNLAGQPEYAAIEAELKAELFRWMEDQSDYLVENQSSPFLTVDKHDLDQDSPTDLVPAEHVGTLAGLTVIPHDITDPNLGQAGTDYETWLITHNLFGSQAFDEDGDKRSNLHEYALGGNPADPTDLGHQPAGNLQSVGGGSGSGVNVFGYSYPKRLNSSSELTYTLEQSTDLASDNWETITPSATTDNLDADYERVSHEIESPNDTLFIRVKVETP
jgi:arylsulfatase A-like enzyme